MFKDLLSEALYCREQTRALMVSVSNSLTATPSITLSRDASSNYEDNISVLPSLNLQPQHKGNHHTIFTKLKRYQQNIILKTTQNILVSARCHSKGSIAILKALSRVNFLPSPGETREVFSRGIIYIQPHSQWHAYFLTFLPDAVNHLPSHVQPWSAPDWLLCTKHAPRTSSKACAVEKGNVQLAHCQTQN
ncbi:hypothetical protein IFM46972_10965 [Aspergillus udagawae]|uniref:Uncharacterized protein n=1 Tax=Aspergillus udagawae TaxID=91492 RepID=A0A8H3SEY6_9EURO|nr:hypothetical protein IFM46972_10965 [Aspergillus udagawae]